MQIEDVVEDWRARLLNLPNVVDVAITEKDGREAILVFVSRKVPRSGLADTDVVPEQIEGYATVVDTAPNVG